MESSEKHHHTYHPFAFWRKIIKGSFEAALSKKEEYLWVQITD